MVLNSLSCTVQVDSEPLSISRDSLSSENQLSCIKEVQLQINTYLTEKIKSSPAEVENAAVAEQEDEEDEDFEESDE